MKSAFGLLAVGVLSYGIVTSACVSGSTVDGSGGTTGSMTGKGGSSSGSLGGTTVIGGQGGATSGGLGGTVVVGGQGGATVGGQGGATVGGQGGATVGGQGGSPVTTGPCTVSVPLIDDVEKVANGTMQGCVHGYWYTYSDGSAGTQTPTNASWMNAAITDRTGSTYAIHSTATGFTGDNATPKNIFAGVGLDFNAAPAPSTAKYTVNASAFKGVTFFAKGTGTLYVELPTPLDDPSLGCAGAKCYDVPAKAITLSGTWTPYTILWADFARQGFGGVTDPLTGANIGGIKFESRVQSPMTFPPYDISIDDVKFAQ